MSGFDEFKDSFKRLLELRVDRDIKKAAATAAEKLYRKKEAELFAELQDANIRGRVEFDFGGDLGTAKFQRRRTAYGRVIDKDAAVAALAKEGHAEMIYDTAVREGRLNELVRDRLESDADLPEGVDFYWREGISISRK